MKTFIQIVILLFITTSAFSINTSEEIEVNYVSINAVSQQVTISWKPYSNLAEIDGYIIYEYAFKLNAWGLDTASAVYVTDKNLNQWTFTYNKVKTQPVKFAVVAYVGSPGIITAQSSYKEIHQTMFSTLSYDSCASQILINWNRYLGWGNSISDYKIFDVSTGSQEGSVPATDSSFIIPNVQANQTYNFYVVASHTNGIYTSLSNIATISTDVLNPPAYIEAQSVNVNMSTTAEITFSIDPNTELHNFQLLQSTDPNVNFAVIRDYQNYLSNTLIASENISGQSTEYFKLQAVDNCDAPSTSSNLATVIVPGVVLNNQEVTISWPDYLLWPQGVFIYSVFRTIGSDPPVQITTLTGSTTQYTDYINTIAGQQLSGNICYSIVARSLPSGTGTVYTANSTSVCIDVATQVFVPEAFTPDGNGLNDDFRPFFAFMPSKFSMIIYNRYGFKVFETQNYVEGWNGLMKNNTKAPEGAYIYFITFETPSGKRIEKNGSFTLIYPSL